MTTSQPEHLSSATPPKIAVVGAGIGGSAVAFFLKQQGFSNLTVFESRSLEDVEAQTKRGNGIHLYSHCARMLVHAGLPLKDVLYPVDLEFRHEDGKLLADITRRKQLKICPELKAIKASAYGILRPQLYGAFHEELKDHIVYDKKCAGVSVSSNDKKKVDVEFQDGTILKDYDLVIGADGINSKIADYIVGKPRKLHKRNVVGLQGWSSYDQWDPDHMEPLFINRDGSGGCGPVPCILPNGEKGMFFWMAIGYHHLEKTTGKKVHELTDEEIFQNVRKRFTAKHLVACLDHAILDSLQRWPDIQDKDPLGPNHWKDKQSGRIVLLGDACHATLPASGYGAGLAIEDAYWLAHFLKTPQDCVLNDDNLLQKALQKYISKRARYTASVVKETRLIMSFMCPPNGLVRRMSNLGWMSGAPGFFIPRKFVSIYKAGLKDTTWTEEETQKGQLDF